MSRPGHLVLALVATAALASCASDGDSPKAIDPTAASASAPAESTDTDSTLALTVDQSAAAGRCAMPNAAALAGFDTAFAGTVTSLADGAATLSVDEWFTGGDASTVTVAAPSNDLQTLLMSVDFQEGRSYLVSADGERVTLCGFTAEDDPTLRALYDEAFAQ